MKADDDWALAMGAEIGEDSDGMFPCKFCLRRKFGNKMSLRIHMSEQHFQDFVPDLSKTHQGQGKGPGMMTPYMTPEVDRGAAYGTSGTNAQRELFTQDVDYKCDMCQKPYLTNSALRIHKQSHHGQVQKTAAITSGSSFGLCSSSSPADVTTHSPARDGKSAKNEDSHESINPYIKVEKEEDFEPEFSCVELSDDSEDNIVSLAGSSDNDSVLNYKIYEADDDGEGLGRRISGLGEESASCEFEKKGQKTASDVARTGIFDLVDLGRPHPKSLSERLEAPRDPSDDLHMVQGLSKAPISSPKRSPSVGGTSGSNRGDAGQVRGQTVPDVGHTARDGGPQCHLLTEHEVKTGSETLRAGAGGQGRAENAVGTAGRGKVRPDIRPVRLSLYPYHPVTEDAIDYFPTGFWANPGTAPGTIRIVSEWALLPHDGGCLSEENGD